MDMSPYKDLFVSETREYLRSVASLIVDLEKNPGEGEKIDALFRVAHSIKGMAASMDYAGIAELAHKLEDLMSRVRKWEVPFCGDVADLLLEGADLIELMVADVERGEDDAREFGTLISRIAGYQPAPSSPVAPASDEAATATGRGDTDPEIPLRRKTDLGDPEQQTVRVKTLVLDQLVDITGELITTKHRLLNISSDLGSTPLRDAVTDLSRLLRVLHDDVMRVRLMPLSTITDRFPRVVRDLAKKNGKEADLVISGQEVDLDRRILEDLSDPLMHILRNAVDHGLEPVQERLAAGKPEKGTISIDARRERDQVILTIADDGRGIDPARLIGDAVKQGFVDSESVNGLSTSEALLLVTLPGFSTSSTVTETSGRGVGMDAVRSTIHSLCGTLGIESEPGRGSRFILKLPVSASIINVLLILSGKATVAVPVTNILRTFEIRTDCVMKEGKHEFFVTEGEEVPLFDLNRVLRTGPHHHGADRTYLPVFVCDVNGRRVGFTADRFLGHQEVFVKPLGRPFPHMKGVAGGAILGDGKVIFILDVASLS